MRRIQDLSRDELESYCKFLKKKNSKLEVEINTLKLERNKENDENAFYDLFKEVITKRK